VVQTKLRDKNCQTRVRFIKDAAPPSLRTQPIRMHYSTDITWRRQAIADHRRIIEVLKGTDSSILSAICREHLQGPKLQYLKLYHGVA
jgi:DNA-binding GntR family transcriptional regulator